MEAPAGGSTDSRLRLGDTIPDFSLQSTRGQLAYHRWSRGRWAILFSHPAAFTPVCTSELGQLAAAAKVLEPWGFGIATLSCDHVKELAAWKKDIEAAEGCRIAFPMLADPTREVAVKLGMLDPVLKDKHDMPLPSRTVFITDPEQRITYSASYPGLVGRNISELVRVCDALLLTTGNRVATPASWPNNHGGVELGGRSLEGCVLVSSAISDEEARRLFPDHVDLAVPSGLHYMRLTHVERGGPQRGWQRLARAALCLCSPAGAGRPQHDVVGMAGGPSPSILPQLWSSLRLTKARADLIDQRRPWQSTDSVLRLGDVVPDFTAETTQGRMNFHRWIEGRWTVLFSHPAAFTPVCTTEVGTLAMKHNSLRTMGFQVAILSADTLADISAWRKDVASHFDNQIVLGFPMIADASREVSVKLGMLDPNLKDSQDKPRTSRTVFVIGPDKKIHLSLDYPGFVGRNIHEIVRACEAVRLSAVRNVATPANWPNNHPDLVVGGVCMKGSVFVTTSAEDDGRLSDCVKLPVPSGRGYLSLAHVKIDSPVVSPCTTCIAGVYKQ